MGKKSVRDMGAFERRRHSLSIKSALGVQGLALVVGLLILVAGFVLYFLGILYEYSVMTNKLAQAEIVMLDKDEAKAKCDEIVDLYDSIPDSEKTDPDDPAYNSKFDGVIDDDYKDIQDRLSIMKEEIGLRNAFVVAIDEETNQMIYLVDSDPNPETVCHPGTWDVYDDDDIDVLVHGSKVNWLHAKYGLKDRPQATITNTPKYGLRCTGGATLYATDKYTIMVCLDEKLDHMWNVSKAFLVQYVILLLIVVVLIGIIALFLIRRIMVKPLVRMSDAAREYAEDKQAGSSKNDHFKHLDIRSGDELEELNLTMADMEDNIAEYVENLTRVTAERERISTELGLAARIQEDMLPTTFPAFPDRNEFDVYAVMDPAIEVGGDFYDFFMIDDDHLALMIADVSGKGIPASLFMMISKIILDNRIMEAESPSIALEHANTAISQNNMEEMFVTVWLGILEISKGRIVASNAGHEKPVIIHSDGRAELIDDKHGFVVGGMGGVKYPEYELQLEPGDKLFVYTDGVPEATSKMDGLFGTDRMVAALEGHNKSSAEEVLKSVQDAVDDFVGDDEQFDDLTMLCLDYRGK